MKKTILCIICAVAAFCSAFFGIFGSFDRTVGDILYHHPSSVNPKIKIIKIDDHTMSKYGDFSDWNRVVYADLIETLCVSEEIKPAVIGFDILFTQDNKDEHDERFARLCAESGNVITGFSYSFGTRLYRDSDGTLIKNDMYVEDKALPYPSLKEVTEQAFVNTLMRNDDSYIRSGFIYFDEEDGTRAKSFSSAVYERYMEFCGKEAVYPTDKGAFEFRYSGKCGDYENISLCDVIDGTVQPEVFDDCIVLVGAYAAGMMDSYFVPVDRGELMYGVEIHANIIQAYMNGKLLNSFPAWADGLIAAGVAVLLILLCDKLSVIWVIVLCLGTAGVKLGTGAILFNSGYTWDNLTLPVISVIIAAYFTILHYYKAKAAKQSIEKAFSKYVAPQVVSEIAKSGTYELKLGGENRDVAVLFVDIRGFTPLSESLEPEQVVDILNSYLELTTNCIFRHGGTLDKFIGDATMAVFNAPFDTDDYIYKAVLAAWDIVQGGNKIEEQFVERYGKHVGFGVGVNCGPAVVGNIGCDFRMDYTAIGDTVNTAARLEANAPRGTVYISHTVYEQIKDRITVEEVGEIPLKGKSKGVFVYSITGINAENKANEVQ